MFEGIISRSFSMKYVPKIIKKIPQNQELQQQHQLLSFAITYDNIWFFKLFAIY